MEVQEEVDLVKLVEVVDLVKLVREVDLVKLVGEVVGEVDLVKLVREVASANRSHWMHFNPLCQNVTRGFFIC